jgi:hypothetical protein
LFCRLQYGIQPTQYCHWQHDIAILAPHVEVTKNIICNSPDEANNAVVLIAIHEFDSFAVYCIKVQRLAEKIMDRIRSVTAALRGFV